jgi:hypothetical protein
MVQTSGTVLFFFNHPTTPMNEWTTNDKKIKYCERTLLNYAEVRNGESIFRGTLCGLRLDGVCVHVRPVVRFVGPYVILQALW